MKNHAFIDTQNVHHGIETLGWEIDWVRLRNYLRDKYQVEVIYLFLGYIPKFERLYKDFEESGYKLVFKPVSYQTTGKIKGNCDADLIVKVLTSINEFNKAIIVTSDGDFYSLVRHLYEINKLEVVLSPYPQDKCSSLLKKEARGNCIFMSTLYAKIARILGTPESAVLK